MFGLIAAITTKVAVEMFATGAGAAISLLCTGSALRRGKMIKIEYPKDLNTLKNKGLNSLITAYISDYFDMLTKVNRCSNLAEIGAIYLLEGSEDCKKYFETGLSKPFEKSLPEFAEVLTIKNSTDKIKLLHNGIKHFRLQM